jgi:hypothetical protein
MSRCSRRVADHPDEVAGGQKARSAVRAGRLAAGVVVAGLAAAL